MGRRSVIAALLWVLSAVAHGQATYFNLFQPPPSTGVMKGSPNTYVTTNAAASDVITLFNSTSTCTSPSTEFLRADGICAVPAGSGSGSVTSVALSAPASLFSVSGSPITGSGTLALSYATGQAPTELFGTDGSGNVSLFALTGTYVPPINLASTANGGITNTLGVAHGGTGDATLTAHGVLIGEGTSAITALTAMGLDTLLQGQGTSADPAAVSVPNCGSGTQALSYSTSTHAFGCQTISAGTGTVTSIGMTVPSVLSVTPASITTNGTFALSFAGSQAANMGLFTPNGTTGPLGLRNLVAADLPTSGVTAGSYTNSNITVDAWGRVTLASNGTGGGGVSSVGLSAPSVFSVSGSPITSSGTLALSFAPGLTANQFLATPDGLTGAVSLRSIVADDVSALSPTWTGNNTFTPASGVGVTINGTSGHAVVSLTSGNSATSGVADVFLRRAGSTANNVAQGPTIQLQDSTNGTGSIIQQSGGQTEFWQLPAGSSTWIQGMHLGTNSGLVVGNPPGGDKGTGTVNTAATIYQNNTPVCLSSGANCPFAATVKVASGTMTSNSGGTCTINQNTGSSIGGCTRTGTGVVQVTATGFSSGSCTASGSGSIIASAVGALSGNTQVVDIFNFSGSSVDGQFSIVCVGQ